MDESNSTMDLLQKVLQQALGGDQDALGKLLELHRGYFRTLAARDLHGRLEPRMTPSDIVQQSFLSVCRKFPTFQGQTIAEFVAWAKRIQERNLQDAVKHHVGAVRRSLDREQSIPNDWAVAIEASQQPSPSTRLLESEQAVVLTLAMESLPIDQREAVRLKYLEGLSLRDVADRLGRPEVAVAGLLKRGMQTLRRLLKNERESLP